MIAEILKRGEKNAITSRELAEKTGIEKRALFRAIEEERRRGALIVAGDTGYFLPETRDELYRGYMRYTSTARKIFSNAKYLKQALEQYDGQEAFSCEQRR